MARPILTRFLPLLAVAVGAVTACGVSSEKASPTTTKPHARGGPEVTLTSVGTGAKHELRLHLQAGARTHFSVTATTKIVQTTADGRRSVAAPPVVEDISMRIVDVKDGVATFHFAVTDARLDEPGALSSEQIQNVEAALHRLVGLTSDGKIDDRGAVVSSAVHIPSSVPAALRQIMQQLDDQLATLSVPLPEEAVGAGATWTSASTAKLSGARVAIRSQYRLLQANGRLFSLAVTQHQTADPQPFELPTLPAGAKARIVSWDVNSRGTTALRLGNLFPTGILHASGTQSFTITEGKTKPQKFTQDLSIETKVTDLGN